jgi:hypothetical protein
MADHHICRLSIAEQPDQGSGVILGRIQSEIRVRHFQLPFTDDSFDPTPRPPPRRVPRNEITDLE